MNKYALLAAGVVIGATTTHYLATFVTLQTTTPGTAESGNINVSGTALVGKVGIGTTAPTALIDARSTLTSTGVYGRTAGSGVRGQSTAASGSYAGGTFESNTPSGFGVYGVNKATSGTAYGGYFQTMSTAGNATGVKGVSPNTGVHGYGSDVGSSGVFGNVDTQGSVAGYFLQQSGVNSSSAVFGLNNSNTGIGVTGSAPLIATAYGLYSYGNSGATGTKSMVIDDPADPEKSALRQFCTEGDKPYLNYRGSVKLDSAGTSWVTLPDYFESINKDALVDLTPVKASMPNLYVAEEVENGKFKIAGGKANGKVYWSVTGTRNDLYMQKVGAPARVAKVGDQVGKYYSPTLYGKPQSEAVGFVPAPISSSVNTATPR